MRIPVDQQTRQGSGPSWSFEPPAVAPIKASCKACGRSVAVLQPRVTGMLAGRYAIEGICRECGATVKLILP